MGDVQADLRSYYEEEARLGTRKPLTGRRVEFRDHFLELLASEGRSSVLDFGAGPGGDGRAFIDAGHRYLGIDLAHGNGVLAAAAGLTVLQASIAAPPIQPQSFDAGWSMSTLMHIPEADVEETLAAMTAALRPNSPMAVGQWGGRRSDEIDSSIEGQRRLFSHRPLEQNVALLETCGVIEHTEVWDIGRDDDEYQVIIVRASS